MEFSGNMFLRLVSECKMGRCFLIKLLILGNIGLDGKINRWKHINCVKADENRIIRQITDHICKNKTTRDLNEKSSVGKVFFISWKAKGK